MSHFLRKSEQNIQSAEHLILIGYFDSSVHCAYYSCVQKMIYVVTRKRNISQVALYKECKKSFHNHLAKECVLLLSQQNIKAVHPFSKLLGELKETRVSSDYKDEAISRQKAQQCLDKARHIHNIIIDEFLI